MDKKLVAKELLKIAKSLVVAGVYDKQFILQINMDALPMEGDPLDEISHALVMASRKIRSLGITENKTALMDENNKKIGYFHARQKPIKASENVSADEDVDAANLLQLVRRKGDDEAVEAEKDVDAVSLFNLTRRGAAAEKGKKKTS